MTRADLRAIAAVTALGALLRLVTLDVQSFWYDEAVTVGLLDQGFGDMLDQLPDSESTPPLYYALAWLWSKPFGLGEAGLRSFSALLGTAAVPVAWLAARELVSRRAALLVALFAAVNPLLVWYSQEARAYALVLLLGTLSLWLFTRLMKRQSGRDAALWGLVSALAIATHYFAAFVIAAEAVLLIARAPGRRDVVAATGVVALAAAALLPLAVTQENAGFASFIADEPMLERVAKVGKQLVLGFDSPFETVTATMALLVAFAGAAVALLRPDPGDRRGVVLAATIGAAGLALPLVVAAAGYDYVLTRNLILAWVPLAVVVAAGLTAARAGRMGMAGAIVLGVLMLECSVAVPFDRALQRDNWRGAAHAIGKPGGLAIVVTDPELAVPIRLYRPDARRAAGGEVREVVLIARRGHDLGDSVPAPPSPAAVAALGLRPAGGKREPGFELVKLRPAGGRARLSAQQLQALRLSPERDRAAVLFE